MARPMVYRVVRAVVVAIAALAIAGGPIPDVQAQERPAGPSVRTAGTSTNLFATFDLAGAADGFEIECPDGWSVEDVTVLRYGSEAVPVELQSGERGRTVARLSRSVRGPIDVVVRVQVAPRPGVDPRWAIAPFEEAPGAEPGRTVRAAQRVEQRVRVEPEDPDAGPADNHVLAFSEGAPLLLRSSAAPVLGRGASSTVEMWVATTGLSEVILSTWTGNESEAYALEMVVDPSGRLRAYHGRPGRHHALISGIPIADGRWHHVAVVHDATRRTLSMVVDGTPVDSLEDVDLPSSANASAVAVGGRLQGGTPGEERAERSMAYSGRIDGLRIWEAARAPDDIAAGMRTPASTLPEDLEVAALDFETDDERAGPAVASWPESVSRVADRIPARTGVQDLRAATDGASVRLEWEAPSTGVERFIVKRSSRPSGFSTIARLRPEAARRRTGRYAYTDEEASGQVFYYRVVQTYRDGSTDASGTLKVGVGADTTAAGVTLVGNFPNPFQETTTVTYEVNRTQPVTVTIWNLAGHQVARLASGVHAPGYYERAFGPDDLPSGTYFVRLETPTDVQSHRMVLLR